MLDSLIIVGSNSGEYARLTQYTYFIISNRSQGLMILGILSLIPHVVAFRQRQFASNCDAVSISTEAMCVTEDGIPRNVVKYGLI